MLSGTLDVLTMFMKSVRFESVVLCNPGYTLVNSWLHAIAALKAEWDITKPDI